MGGVTEWAFTVVVLMLGGLVCWWAALILLAVKGLIFNRNDQYPVPKRQAAKADDHLLEAPTLPRGCLWTLGFFCWPLMLADSIDERLRRTTDGDKHNS
jgi:hypothetical protein